MIFKESVGDEACFCINALLRLQNELYFTLLKAAS